MKLNNSGPAIFMYIVIGVTLLVAIICFGLYYLDINTNKIVLWSGITAFTIMYHLWLRIIFGNISRAFQAKLKYTQKWFKERKFEPSIYKMLKVKKWKDKALTYNPELFSLKDYSLEEVANTMCKAEVDHWINEIISLSTIAFGLIWGKTWIFVITAICACVFDAQFIVIQRYNRPRIVRVLAKKNNNKKVTGNNS